MDLPALFELLSMELKRTKISYKKLADKLDYTYKNFFRMMKERDWNTANPRSRYEAFFFFCRICFFSTNLSLSFHRLAFHQIFLWLNHPLRDRLGLFYPVLDPSNDPGLDLAPESLARLPPLQPPLHEMVAAIKNEMSEHGISYRTMMNSVVRAEAVT